MFIQPNKQIQTQFDHINRELTMLQNQRLTLENQQTRLKLLHQFQQQGVTRTDYIGFQPQTRHIAL
jgi:hypothetical protein